MVEKLITDKIFEDMIEEMGRRMDVPKGINFSHDGMCADHNPEHLVKDDTQIGVEFAVEYLNSHFASLVEENERLRKALEPFGSGGNWGTVKAMIVNGATVPQNGVDLAKWLSSMNAKADAALGREP
jgi:hypothetical protein